MESFQLEMAHRFCSKALEQEPDHLRALEMMAEVLLEGGDLDSARLVTCVFISILIHL